MNDDKPIVLSDLETANKKDNNEAYLDSSAVADGDDGDGVVIPLVDEEHPTELGSAPILPIDEEEAA